MMRRGRGGPAGTPPPGPGPMGAGPGGAGNQGPDRYKMRENLISIGDDYWIETQQGRRAFFIDGKALRVRDTLKMKDTTGREVYEIQSKIIPIKQTMGVTRGNQEVATVKKALVTPLRDRMTANLAGGPDIDIHGNIVAHEYVMERGGRRVAEVSKKWLRLADTYTVEVAPGEDDALILALSVVVDQMAHD